MNYSTLKKTVGLSLVSLMAVAMVNAQTTTTTTTTTDSTKMSSATTTAKTFGGARQYSTWSLGVNVGVTSPFLAIGGSNATTNWKAGLGYGISLRDKLAHSFSLQLDFHGGKVSGDNTSSATGLKYGYQSFETTFYSGSLTGLVNVASVDFLHRKNSVNFYLSAGAGLAVYNPSWVTAGGASVIATNPDGSNHYIKELILPVGGSVKFKLSDALALNVGYTMNFVDGYNFSGYSTYPNKDHYSYGYAGLEYTFGTKSKPNMDWVNPVAMMYDELYDEALRQEVAALKGRVTNVETAVNDLKKDSDGDGVADQFDKCPNTPAGTVVDGSGCPIVFPKPDTVRMGGTGAVTAAAYSNIQFEFDSSVLKTSSYPVLDATSADLRANSSTVTLAGYASSEGTAAHNMRLSKDRANSVKTYLVNSGVDAKRLKVKAFGETHPIADNSTEEGRIQNRRVEFHK
ncbi:MAG TPA: OmpA family protein [Mucilaginibacter sp.]|jgi:OOP family OmpA-OmpF porin|nr:OmpA family protein [Mucilaginibacter sp.]